MQPWSAENHNIACITVGLNALWLYWNSTEKYKEMQKSNYHGSSGFICAGNASALYVLKDMRRVEDEQILSWLWMNSLIWDCVRLGGDGAAISDSHMCN